MPSPLTSGEDSTVDLCSIYKAHPLEPNTTRVLRVLPSRFPGNWDIISCWLEAMSINPPPQYRAASYVWADPTITKLILVEDAYFTVCLNLWHFLMQMRAEKYTDLLWVDAICINQDDLSERSEQVAIMGQIYSKATEVRAWLGLGTDTQASALRCLHTINWSSYRSDIYWSQLYPWKGRIRNLVTPFVEAFRGLKRHYRTPNGSMETLTRLIEIWDSEYWSRIWTIQEYASAPRLIVQIGSATIDAGVLEECSRIILRIFENGYGQWDKTIETLRFNNGIRVIKARFERWDRNYREDRQTFPELLNVFTQSRCADLHDRVYSLLGLDPIASSTIVTDYVKPIPQLFSEVVNHLETESPLSNPSQSFTLNHLIGRFSQALGLSDECAEVEAVWRRRHAINPSWVPDSYTWSDPVSVSEAV